MHTISSQNAGRARACAHVYVYIVTFPVFLGVCLFAYLNICASVHQRAQNEQILPPASTPANQHVCPPSGASGHVHRPRAQNYAIFLHAATRWHSARYARFKRNSRKFLQNFFAKNLVCVPKVRTFALANQK